MTEVIQVWPNLQGEGRFDHRLWRVCGTGAGRDGLVHISELDHGYVNKVGDVCKVGDPMEVIVSALMTMTG